MQNSYGLDLRPADTSGLIDDCGAHGIAFVPYFAIAGQRREAGAGGEHHHDVLAVARAHGVTPAQVRPAWTLHRGPQVPAIPGTRNTDHLAENIAAGALRLSPAELDRLEPLRRQPL